MLQVTFLGSTQVSKDRGDRIIYDTIQRIQDARKQHDMQTANQLYLDVSNQQALKLVDKEKVVQQFSLETYFWKGGQRRNAMSYNFILESVVGRRNKYYSELHVHNVTVNWDYK